MPLGPRARSVEAKDPMYTYVLFAGSTNVALCHSSAAIFCSRNIIADLSPRVEK